MSSELALAAASVGCADERPPSVVVKEEWQMVSTPNQNSWALWFAVRCRTWQWPNCVYRHLSLITLGPASCVRIIIILCLLRCGCVCPSAATISTSRTRRTNIGSMGLLFHSRQPFHPTARLLAGLYGGSISLWICSLYGRLGYHHTEWQCHLDVVGRYDWHWPALVPNHLPLELFLCYHISMIGISELLCDQICAFCQNFSCKITDCC